LVSVLKPPSDGVGPGRTAGLLVSRKQSSYDREGEGVLLAAVFEGGEEVRQEVTRLLHSLRNVFRICTGVPVPSFCILSGR
jgi:hypothetical protein